MPRSRRPTATGRHSRPGSPSTGTSIPATNKILRRCRTAKHCAPTADALVSSPVVSPVMASRAATVERLRAVPLFARCTTRDLRIVARHVDLVEVPEGVDVVREGEEGETFFVVLEGRAAIMRRGRKIDELTPGSHFGELALLDPAPRSVTVRGDHTIAARRTRPSNLQSTSARNTRALSSAFGLAGGTAPRRARRPCRLTALPGVCHRASTQLALGLDLVAGLGRVPGHLGHARLVPAA